MKNQKIVFMSFLVLALFITSCQPTVPSAGIPQNDGIADVRVNTAPPTETKINTEEFPLPNCGGTGEIRQTLGTTASVFKSITIGAKATARGGGEAIVISEPVILKLEIEVEVAYQKTYESASSRLDSIDMPAAAGSHVVYEIGWYEQTFESIVEYSSDGQVYEAPYVYKLRIPKIENSYQVSCNGSSNSGQGITPQPTSVNSGLRWEQEAAQVPASGTSLKWELAVGQILFLSGGQIRINGEYCGGDANQICVLVFQATTPQTVIVDALIPENNWYGISSTLSPDDAVSEKEPQFWYPPNCINGCKKATVLYFTNGKLVNKTTLTP